MFQATTMSNSTLSDEATLSSFNNPLILQNTNTLTSQQQQKPKKPKKTRSLPGNPDPDAEVIALSPKSLLATNRFICEVCNKGFQRDQNLQLHRRGHNLPWKLKQRNKLEVMKKKAYVCPEPSCVHHHPSRALGDLTGIKKHFCRKHGEKKFKCDKCSKIYAVHSDWKAHSKTCGTREYRCDCGTLFSRKDSFITHRAFCDALAEESVRLSTNPFSTPLFPQPPPQQPPERQSPFPYLSTTRNPNDHLFPFPTSISTSSISLSSSPWDLSPQNPNNLNQNNFSHIKTENDHPLTSPPPPFFQPPPLFTKSGSLTSPFTTDTNTITAHFLSATALLQKATSVGATFQQSQQTQQAQAMLAGFDELGASFRNVGPTTTTNMVPPQTPSSSTTTTAEMTTNRNTHHNQYTMGMNTPVNLSLDHTWRKNNADITRDFLGLTAGDQFDHHSNGNNNGVNCRNIEEGFQDDDMVGNMLKFTGSLQHYSMTTPFDRDNSSPSPSSLLLKPQPHLHHHHQEIDQGSFGNFSTAQPPTAAATSDSRWG